MCYHMGYEIREFRIPSSKIPMKIYFASDHGGYALKQQLIAFLSRAHTVLDCGNTVLDPNDDASDYVQLLAEKMSSDPDGRGIVICRSGGAVQIAANRYSHIRATAGRSPEQVRADRRDDHINVLALAADYISVDSAKELIDVFLNTHEGVDERYVRRVRKLGKIGIKTETTS